MRKPRDKNLYTHKELEALYPNLKEIIHTKLEIEKKTRSQIAKELNCSYGTIMHLEIVKYGIEPDYFKMDRAILREHIINEYWDKKKNIREIANDMGYDKYITFKNFMERLHIKVRRPGQNKKMIRK